MKVALTGAAGAIGSVLRPRLLARGFSLRSAALEALAPLEGEETVDGDLRDPAVVDRVLGGAEALVHLAGTSVERPLAEIIENNLRALHEVYEGAKRHRVRRVVFASSNHAIGMVPVETRLALDCAVRPDGMYGLSKVWGEAMARLYWDKHGISSVCLRIGSALPRPVEPRHLATWLGHDDLEQLVVRAVETADLGFLIAWGVSANTRGWWDNRQAAALGYVPQQNAEDYAAEILAAGNPLSSLGQRLQGGSFAAEDCMEAPKFV